MGRSIGAVDDSTAKHDPLCAVATDIPQDSWDFWCDCDYIAKIRDDQTSQCIAVIRDMIDTAKYNGGGVPTFVDHILTELRALQEKP